MIWLHAVHSGAVLHITARTERATVNSSCNLEQNRKQDWKEALCESDGCQNEGKRNYCGNDFRDKWNRICLVSHTTVIHWNCQSSTLMLVVLLGGLTLAGSCSKRGQNCTNVRQVCLLGSLAHGSLNNSFKIIKKNFIELYWIINCLSTFGTLPQSLHSLYAY